MGCGAVRRPGGARSVAAPAPPSSSCCGWRAEAASLALLAAPLAVGASAEVGSERHRASSSSASDGQTSPRPGPRRVAAAATLAATV